jgi:hypothetical protein
MKAKVYAGRFEMTVQAERGDEEGRGFRESAHPRVKKTRER